MAVTTVDNEIKRLRNYLSPYLKGKNVDAVIAGLAQNSAYLINNIAAVNDQLYISTASATYLDALLEPYVQRPPSVGLDDSTYREIGIQVKNRKQVRDLLDQLLNIMFGDEFTKANVASGAFQPYALQDGDTLIISYDGGSPKTITFHTSQFQNIGTATAQEVADVIVETLSSQNFTGSAAARNNGINSFVELISTTIGPASSVQVLGGRAQNILKFPSIIPNGGNMSTQWAYTFQPNGLLRFTWVAGPDPQLGKVSPGDYVSIFGPSWVSTNDEGSFTIVNARGGTVGNAFFEISNPTGSTGNQLQGTDDAILFYTPTKTILSSQQAYAAIYQVQSNTLQIFLPAATKVVRRERIGSAHIHSQPSGIFTFHSQPNTGDVFGITISSSLTVGIDFFIGGTISETLANLSAAINLIPGLVAFANPTDSLVLIQNDSLTNILSITYTGAANIVASGPLGDNVSLEPNQQGPYIFDTKQTFTVGHENTKLTQAANGSSQIINVGDSSQFPDAQGFIVIGYGSANEEGPIPYISRPSSSTILVSPAYTLMKSHAIGESVSLIPQKAPVSLSLDGTDYPFILTDIVGGRVFSQEVVNLVAAAGINVVYTILFPGDRGLGKWSTPFSEITTIYGESDIPGQG